MPKIMQIAARIGLESVIPNFLNPFSTTSVKTFYPPNILTIKNLYVAI
jgi:hypothetical protein